MPVRQVDLAIDAGASFAAGPFLWIAGNAGVDLTGTTRTVLFRQLPTDPPLLQLSSSSVPLLPAVSGYQYLPTSIEAVPNPPDPPVVITVYPFQLVLTLANVTAIATVPYCAWSMTVGWPNGTSVVLMGGNVTVRST